MSCGTEGLHTDVEIYVRVFIYKTSALAAVYMCEWEKSQPEKVKEKVSEEAGKDALKGGADEPGVESTETETDNAELDSGHIQDIPPASVGVTYELCARPVDKPDLSLEEIARQEVLEECGYDVPVAKLRRITSYRYIPFGTSDAGLISLPLPTCCPFRAPHGLSPFLSFWKDKKLSCR